MDRAFTLPVDDGYVTRLRPPGVLADVLREGGWSEVAVEELESQMVMPSGDQVWAFVAGVGGVVSTILAE